MPKTKVTIQQVHKFACKKWRHADAIHVGFGSAGMGEGSFCWIELFVADPVARKHRHKKITARTKTYNGFGEARLLKKLKASKWMVL